MADNETIPISPHTEAARDLLQRIRAVQESSGSKTLLQPLQSRKLTAAASVSDEFLEAVAVALDAYEKLAAAAETNSAELRDAVAYSRAFRPVVDELRLAATALLQAINAKRAEAGQKALKSYSFAKAFNRPNDKAMLMPHLAAMQRALGKVGRRKAVTAPAPEAPAATLAKTA